MDVTTYVGMDVHVKTVVLGVAREGGEPYLLKTIANDDDQIARTLRPLARRGPVQVCYEAGPCGYGIQRLLSGMGIACQVVAPSLIPQQSGNRVKTDSRDARQLARLLRSGDLTTVAVPTPEQEGLRALSRLREAVKGDLQRVRQRLIKFLAQQHVVEPAQGLRWTRRYWRWLDGVVLVEPTTHLVLTEHRAIVRAAEARVRQLHAELESVAATHAGAPLITALRRIYGIGLLTAVGIVAEIGDLTRFRRAEQLGAYAGMVPREHSSGGHRQQGAITKTGNPHLRALLVEAAWHYTRPIRPRPPADSADYLGQIADEARPRLALCYHRLVRAGKPAPIAIVAIARKLLAVCWAMAKAVTAQTMPALPVLTA